MWNSYFSIKSWKVFLNSNNIISSTHNKPKSRNWDKWVLPLKRLSWTIYSRYLPLLSSGWLSRLTALTWVPSQAPQPNQTVLTISQIRETETSGSCPSSDYPEQSIPDIFLYWVPADSRDLQLWPEYLLKHLNPTKQYSQ